MGTGTGTVMFEENRDLTQETLNEMREELPDFKIVMEGYLNGVHTAKVFLKEKDYHNFSAKFYSLLLPATFLGANVYKRDVLQYSISTASGEWHKKLKYLEGVLGKIDEQGLFALKNQFNDRTIGLNPLEF
ncbi:MAG: hypothetical protein ACP5NZ_01155 [Nanobdellota archaeon]